MPEATREGQPVPQVKFRYRANNEWKEITSDQLFKGRTVAVFSLPGAFTPTCSSTHLPRFNELASTFKDNGVDRWCAGFIETLAGDPAAAAAGADEGAETGDALDHAPAPVRLRAGDAYRSFGIVKN